MPGGDGTGPLGRGPVMGGRGAGGGGRGWRNVYCATGLPRWARRAAPPAGTLNTGPVAPSRDQEISTLQDEARRLKDQLESINKRMDTLSQDQAG